MRLIVVLIALIALVGCSTMHMLGDTSPAYIKKRVAVGDHVAIVATNGKAYDLEVTAVEAASLFEHDAAGKRYKVPYNMISTIEVNTISATGVFWSAVGAIALAAVLWVFYVVGRDAGR